MYKKIIFLAVTMLSAVITFAQPSQYTPMTAQGYQFKRILTDSTLHLPSFCGVPTLRNSTAKNGALAMDTCNNKLYQWTNQAGWTDITTGGIDTTSLSNRINLKVNISDTSSMLSKYLRKIDTTVMLSPYLRKVDTTSMLSKYLRKVDTTAMLQPYLQKIDTTSMLQPYLRKIDTTAMLSKYLRKVDTTAMLSKYLRKIDTTAMLQPYLRKIDTTVMLQPYLQKIDTTAMLSKYLRKIDTTAMLSKYLRKVDTTNKWVTNIVSVNDTTFRFFKGSSSTDIIIKGKGGSGSTPDLQAVTTAGATTTNAITIDGSGGTLVDFKPINIDNFLGDYAYGFETAIGADYYAYPIISSDAYSDSFYIQTYDAGSNSTQRVVGLNNGSGSRFELSTGQSTGASLSLKSSSAVGNHVLLESGSAVATDEIIHLPIMDGNADTLATLADVRSSGGGGNFIDSLKRNAGTDSVFAKKNGQWNFQYKDSIGANPPASGYYGVFQDNTSQSAAVINTAYAVKLNTTDLSNGVTVVNNGSGNPTRITLANTGIYNIQFSLQLEKTGGSGNMIADIWVRKNGVDIPSTTGKVVLTGSANASPIIAAWNYVLDLTGGDYIELMWSTSNVNVEIVAASAATPHPAIPSAIVTITQQAGIMAGTGITAINSLTGDVQTMTTGTSGTDFAISSTGTTHTFNLPTASATNTGKLSSANWTTFNGKIGSSDTATMLAPYARANAVSSGYLSSDATTTNLTATNTNLTFPIAAGETWRIMIAGTAKNSGTGGVKIAINAPTGATMRGILSGGAATMGSSPVTSALNAINTLSTTFATGNNVEVSFRFEGVVVNSSTGGNVTLQFAAGTSGTATIFNGTLLQWSRTKPL
jgi:hypothetical protein